MKYVVVVLCLLAGMCSYGQSETDEPMNGETFRDDESDFKSIADTLVLNTSDDLKRMGTWSPVGEVLDEMMGNTFRHFCEYVTDKEILARELDGVKNKYIFDSNCGFVVYVLKKVWDKFDFRKNETEGIDVYFGGEILYTDVRELTYPQRHREELYVLIGEDRIVEERRYAGWVQEIERLYEKYGFCVEENDNLGGLSSSLFADRTYNYTAYGYDCLYKYRYLRYDAEKGFRWLDGEAPDGVPEEMMKDLKDLFVKREIGCCVVSFIVPSEFLLNRGKIKPSIDNVVIELKDAEGVIAVNNMMGGKLAKVLSQRQTAGDYCGYITDKELLRKVLERELYYYKKDEIRVVLSNLDIFDFRLDEEKHLEIYAGGKLLWKVVEEDWTEEIIDNKPYVSKHSNVKAYKEDGTLEYDRKLVYEDLEKIYKELAPEVMKEELVYCSTVEMRSNGEVTFMNGDKSETSPEIYDRVIKRVREEIEKNHYSRIVFTLLADLRKEEEEEGGPYYFSVPVPALGR